MKKNKNLETAMGLAREFARPTTNAIQARQLLEGIRHLIGGRIGQSVPEVIARAMGFSEAEIANWPKNL